MKDQPGSKEAALVQRAATLMRLPAVTSLGFGLALVLAGCGASPTPQVTKGFAGADAGAQSLPAVQGFAAVAPVPALRSNAEMAADFLDLEFRMESGRPLPVLTRFEGPIRVRMTGAVPAAARAELGRVIQRFRREAGLDIAYADGAEANIVIDFRPRSALRRAVPSAACFVVPNVASFDQYMRMRNSPQVDWAQIMRRDRAAIFVPSDTSPQEVRDCLHEELAQAMGPLNDLFRLPDSVFNDDNFHAVLTGFDMLMLRTHYAPELRSGMTREEVAARLPAILARLNPRGQSIPGSPRQMTPRAWISAVQSSFTGTSTARLSEAETLVSIARAQGWADGRLAFSYFARARARTGTDMQGALSDYAEAARIWRSLPGGAIHAAHVDMQLSAFALSAGQFDRVIELTTRAIPVARQHQNGSLVASLLAMKAEALAATGRSAEARSTRLDSLAWARYAFGSDAQVRARMSDIAALASRGARG